VQITLRTSDRLCKKTSLLEAVLAAYCEFLSTRSPQLSNKLFQI